jgi:hypothetical protein
MQSGRRNDRSVANRLFGRHARALRGWLTDDELIFFNVKMRQKSQFVDVGHRVPFLIGVREKTRN